MLRETGWLREGERHFDGKDGGQCCVRVYSLGISEVERCDLSVPAPKDGGGVREECTAGDRCPSFPIVEHLLPGKAVSIKTSRPVCLWPLSSSLE